MPMTPCLKHAPILLCLLIAAPPVTAEDTPAPVGAAVDTASASAPVEMTLDDKVAELMAALVDARSSEAAIRRTSDAMRKEALLLDVVADQLLYSAGDLSRSADALEMALQHIKAQREPVEKFGEPVSAERAAVLTRGVNMSHWFSQSDTGTYEYDYLKAKYTEYDFNMLREVGFLHLRLPFDNAVLFNPDAPDELNPELAPLYFQKMNDILDAGLAVIIAIQPGEEFKLKLKDPEFAAKVTTFWNTLATHLSDTDPDRVFLEVLNEPTRAFSTPQWRPLQWRMLQAMRAGAPEHTLIASGGNYSGPEDLMALEPYPDRNIIYNWHHYKPFAFTHQGASWGKETWTGMAQIPWPMTSEGVWDSVTNARDRSVRMDLIGTTWNTGSEEAMKTNLQQVADWAKAHDVRVTCNEMGVYIPKSDRASRLRWHRAMVNHLDELGIGWAIWDYSSGFDIVTVEDGKYVLDLEMMEALGLSKTEQPAEGAQ